MRTIFKVLGTALAVYLAATWVNGITVDDFWTAILVALVLALLNAIVKPILQLISIPLIILTLGFFLVVINAALLIFAGDLVPDFTVDGFWPAVWGSLIISIVSYFLDPPRQNNRGDGNSGNGGNGGGISVRFERRG
ncbi:MAG: phage holin family protein [Bacteroidota bacterium]